MNLAIKLKVQRFLYFRDQADPFLRSCMQTLGAHHLQRWTVPLDNLARAKESRAFYREVGAAITFFEMRFSWDYLSTVKRRKLYWDTVENVTPEPLYRKFHLTTEAQNVFKRLRKLSVPAGAKDLFTKFHCEVLPVKVWLQRKGFFVPWSVRCDLCSADEDLFHVFVNCKRARDFWEQFIACTGLEINIDWFSVKFLVFDGCEDNNTPAALVVIGLHSLWRYRMAISEGKVKPKTPWNRFLTSLEWVYTVVTARDDDVTCSGLKSLLHAITAGNKKAI